MLAWSELRIAATLILTASLCFVPWASTHQVASLVNQHVGCGHHQVLETEQRLVARSLFLREQERAREHAQPATVGAAAAARQLLAQAAPSAASPAAPRVHLSFQLAGYSSNASLAAAIQSSLMPTAVKVLQKMFQVVRPLPGNLLLPPGWGSVKCIEAVVEPEFISGRGMGRPVDYVLYVTSVPCQAGTMAYAGVCAVGGDDSRPIMGAINLCRGAFEELGARRQLETVTHELLHAFVFSPSLFPLFKAGDPRRNVSGPYGATTALASPAVVAALRQLSGCASAAGVPLEDEGSGGSRGSHWEARLFQGELMLSAAPFAGRSDKLPRLQLTAALLQDSGWYLPRAAAVPPLDFGAGAGCGWLGSAAGAWAAGRPGQQLYCNVQDGAAVNGTLTCTYDYQAVAECFRTAQGGTNFLNGVPFPYAQGGASNCLASSGSSSSSGKASGGMSPLGSWRGASAVCYPVTQQLTDITGTRSAAGAGCWDTTCGQRGELYITLRFGGGANSMLLCPTGKTLNLAQALPKRFSSGMLKCPDNARVCGSAADSCGSCIHGYCLAGRCHCALDWLGDACDVHILYARQPSGHCQASLSCEQPV
ncbi:hypothetical protein OEZ85_004177 [Tetradesmus obliquus]|uniref:EGF-like domain-containing protein n=1 Tax=Tetradesmus obliquus TaxID=3088 RepID=A0ABY8UJT1_TETOB|nr:hypothetical protein OEZ85_004177 [Tetradesmus obliquus]